MYLLYAGFNTESDVFHISVEVTGLVNIKNTVSETLMDLCQSFCLAV